MKIALRAMTANIPMMYGKNFLKGTSVSYTHLRAHETVLDIVYRLLLEKKNKQAYYQLRISTESRHEMV